MKNHEIYVIALLLLLLISGCDSRDPVSSTYSITVSCYPDTLHVGASANTSDVQAAVTRDGEAVEGVQVNFSTNLGSILGSGETNLYGVAESTYWYEENETGRARITAEFSGVEAETFLYIVDANPFILTVWSEPEVIYLGSGSYSTEIFALLTDRDGFGLENEQITFETDEGFVTPFGTTNANGFAEADYIYSGTTEETVEIRASYGGETAFCDVSIENLDIINITVWAEPDTIFVGTSQNSSEIYAEVKDGFGYPIVDEQVCFSASLGSIISYANTNSQGIANSSFWYSDRPDMMAVITAEYAGIEESITISLLTNQVQIVFLEADPLYIAADNDIETYSLITTRIVDSVSNPVSDQMVSFETGLGYLVQPYAETDSNGYATTQFHDNGIPGTATIFVNCVNDQSQIDVQILP